MKIKQIVVVLLLTSANLCFAGLTISNPAINRNAGQTIPVTITSSSPTVAYVWMYNAKTWYNPYLLAIDLKINRGVNKFDLPIPFSWNDAGKYVLRILGSKEPYSWGDNVINIRSAIIWPYPGSTYTRGNNLSVTWTVCYVVSDFFNIYLHNMDTDDSYDIGAGVWPLDGRYGFNIPTNIPAGHYKIEIDGFLIIREPVYGDNSGQPTEDNVFYDLSDIAESGVINLN